MATPKLVAEARVLVTISDAEGTVEKIISLPPKGIGQSMGNLPHIEADVHPNPPETPAIVAAICDLRNLLSDQLERRKPLGNWVADLLGELDRTYSAEPGLLLVEEKLEQQHITVDDAISLAKTVDEKLATNGIPVFCSSSHNTLDCGVDAYIIYYTPKELTKGQVLHELAHYVYHKQLLGYPRIEAEKGHGRGFCQAYCHVLEACGIEVPYFPPYEPEQLTLGLVSTEVECYLGRTNFTITKIKQIAWNKAIVELDDEDGFFASILFRLEHEQNKPYCHWTICETESVS